MAAPVWEKVFQSTNNAILSVTLIVIIVITECFFFCVLFLKIILQETRVNHWNWALAADWKCGQTFALPFCLTVDKALQGKRMERHWVCQHHGSSRKITLKSGCGHSMVPTARAYAGVCLDTRLPQSQELWACLHVCLHSGWISEHWFVRHLVLVMWKHAQSCQLSKDSAIISQNPAYSLHMHVSDL